MNHKPACGESQGLSTDRYNGPMNGKRKRGIIIKEKRIDREKY